MKTAGKKSNRLQLQGIKLHILDRCCIAVVSCLLVLVLIAFKVYTYNAEKNQIDLIRMVMRTMSENQKIQFERYVDDKIQILQVLVTYPEIYEMDNKTQREFISERSKDMGFQHFFVVDTDGMGYYFAEDVYRDQKTEIFFHNVMNNDVFITEPFYADYGLVIMTACVSIYDPAGEKVGVLCGAINLQSIQELIKNNETVLEGRSLILNEEGRYVASSNASDVYSSMSVYNMANSDLSLIKSAFRDESDKEGIIWLNGVEYLTCVTYLLDYNWSIVQCIPMSEITQRYEYMGYMQYVLAVLVLAMMLCIFRIVYCWKKSDKKIYTDVLTKCGSRAACLSLLDSLEEKHNQEITIIYMDLNRFKQVNDTYGHDKGDELLCIFSRTLVRVFEGTAFVGRMGGDEFIMVLSDVGEERVQALCEQVEAVLAEESKTLDLPYTISTSYGM